MAILERITKNIDNNFFDSGDWAFPVKNRYTAGVAGQRFFKEIKDNGKIYGTTCENCQLTLVPAKLFCEKCFSKLTKWVDVGTTGTVYTYTVSNIAMDGSDKEPSVIAAICMADGILIHKLEKCKPEDVVIGMKVKAVFKPKNQRKGNLMDISGFVPA